MSDKKDKDAKPKKKGGGMMLKVGAVVALLGAGGGGAYGLVAAGIIGGGSHGKEHEDKNPKLIRKGEEDPYAPAAKEGEKGGEGGGKDVEGEGGSEYRTAYFSFTEDFTSNLKDSDLLVQVSLACSTHRDYRVILWLQKHELAVRSALLTAIADTPGEEVQSAEGKARLQKRLVATINKVLTDTEGFGGVDAVYFKTFIVQ
ncbi:flagellar basal body-associated protein FliL [Novosphingobium fuchskuhlense]|uniref:Flagellar protein FliL n=1 Tax=Novosphingobium fuchskuhlense TaxID=1117702 RepID=A0A117UXL6_9SPHN|nr:flagellar basal body-associated FliL family protein [Novosphingobium fuchskuhlense]KUR72715.1 flagellar basal body-associated protein FliL [Novosphingobium fuchskuhlense]